MSNRVPPPVRVTDGLIGVSASQPAIVVDGSPLALIGIFVMVLRERFTAGNGPSDYVWVEDFNKTAIVIESGFEDNSGERGRKPALFIDKDETVYGKSIIGDRAGHVWKDGKDYQWCLSTVPILIDCVSSRRGESAILGDIVQWTLHASSDAIQAVFSLHDMTPPRLGRTVPYEAEKEAWTTPVSFSVQYNVRWATVPIRPLLQEIALKIRQSGQSAEAYLLDLVTRSKDNLP